MMNTLLSLRMLLVLTLASLVKTGLKIYCCLLINESSSTRPDSFKLLFCRDSSDLLYSASVTCSMLVSQPIKLFV